MAKASKSLLGVTPWLEQEPRGCQHSNWYHIGRRWLCGGAIAELFPSCPGKTRVRLHVYRRPGRDRKAFWIGYDFDEVLWAEDKDLVHNLHEAASAWLLNKSGLGPRLKTGKPFRIYVRAEYA